jgi:hypothetical protein
MVFLDLEYNEVTKQDVYFAQLTAEVVRPNVKDSVRKTLNAKDFILKANLKQKMKGENMEDIELDDDGKPILRSSVGKIGNSEQEARKKKALEAKGFWLGAVMNAKPTQPPEKE